VTDPRELTDPTFPQDLLASTRAVDRVARWLRGFGKAVTIQPLKLRPDISRAPEFSDKGDLRVDGDRIEVKHRSLRFTGPHDFPFPSIIVDVAHAWDNAHPKPAPYVILNQPLTHAAIVPGSPWAPWPCPSSGSTNSRKAGPPNNLLRCRPHRLR
jgi:hypothetical protein